MNFFFIFFITNLTFKTCQKKIESNLIVSSSFRRDILINDIYFFIQFYIHIYTYIYMYMCQTNKLEFIIGDKY